MDEQELQEYIKKKEVRERLIEDICGDATPQEDKVAVFMAGGPGAGKTETAQALKKRWKSVVHIDHDYIKSTLPGYNGANAAKYQFAATLGLDRVFGHVLKKKLNFILDSTLHNATKGTENIQRALKRDYTAYVVFVYQSPENAWRFVEERRKKEGRAVPKEDFVKKFLACRKAVQQLKDEFGEKIILLLARKEMGSDGKVLEREIVEVVDNLDEHIERVYTEKELEEITTMEFSEEKSIHCRSAGNEEATSVEEGKGTKEPVSLAKMTKKELIAFMNEVLDEACEMQAEVYRKPPLR